MLTVSYYFQQRQKGKWPPCPTCQPYTKMDFPASPAHLKDGGGGTPPSPPPPGGGVSAAVTSYRIKAQGGRAGASQKVPDSALTARLLGTRHSGIMREIVHLQAGQCGNQIGAKVSGGGGWAVLYFSIGGESEYIVSLYGQ